MGLKFVYKKKQNIVPSTHIYQRTNNVVVEPKHVEADDYMAIAPQNNKTINEDIKVMDTKEKVEMVNKILESENQSQVKVKKLRKEKGLIERTDNSIIITEENKELLHD